MDDETCDCQLVPLQLAASRNTSTIAKIVKKTYVTRSGSPLDVNVLARLEPLVLLSGADTEGVGTKVVALGLDEVGGQSLGAVAVEERQGGGVGRDGDTPEDGLSNDAPPAGLGVGNGLQEEGRGQEVLELGVLAVSGGNVAQKDRLDDAATAPHGGDAGVVEVPVVDLGGLAHEHEALSVRDDLGGVQSLLQVATRSVLLFRANANSRIGEGTYSMNCCLSPWKGSTAGAWITLEARTRSSFKDDKQRAKTASPIKVTGIP